MKAVKRLSPDELRDFKRQFEKWQKQNGKKVEDEAALLEYIKENSRLPAAQQRRYERLCRKLERGAITERELVEYQSLLQQLEARNVKRIEALVALAKRRGMTLRGIMAELGLKGEDGAK